ncbi:MAG: 50S ribosome-binding GTPase [Bacilli bacterium]|nr:50S ribosome-binding GTPase [Bacilli bacterium]
MIKKCMGCGAIIQYDKPNEPGYVDLEMKEEAEICKRCFRIKSYGDYTFIYKNNDEYLKMLEQINTTNDLVLYLVDMFNIDNDLKDIFQHINNPIILVLTKRDIIPKSVNDQKIINWVRNLNLNFIDIITISSHKNYHIDNLYKLMKKYKTSNNVYVVGKTNAGKSTFINKMIKNYSFNKCDITTSNLPSTTLEQMEIQLNKDFILIDTPGLLDEDNIINVVDSMLLKRIIPKKEIKPRIYPMKIEQSLLIEDIARIDYLEGSNNSFVFYIANEIEIDKINMVTNNKNYRLKKHCFNLESNEDIVIDGLGWIKVVKPGRVSLYVREQVSVFKRDKFI